MKRDGIAEHIVTENERFCELFTKFSLLKDSSEYHQLLVVNNSGELIGVIGSKEIASALRSAKNRELLAAGIMNKKFTGIAGSEKMREECFTVFYNNNFEIIPVVEPDSKKPLGLIHRKDFPEFNMISFSQYDDYSFYEDAILNYVLLDVQDIFYIDAGAFDPWTDSITKWFSLSGRGRGINVEPQTIYFDRLQADRPDDINIQTALSDKDGQLEMNCFFGATTARQEYFAGTELITVPATALRKVCAKHVPNGQDIHFLKVDVEGYEKEVLLGADFSNYRPWIVVLEATKPGTEIPVHDEWECILFANKYEFARQYGINRFYVASEQAELVGRFVDVEVIKKRMNIRFV